MNSQHRLALISRRVVVDNQLRSAAVLVEGQQIAGIVDPRVVPADFPAEDLGALVIAPGLIDTHVHINEPGRSEWEGFETATRAAAAGGVTLMVDMPLNSDPVTTSLAALAAKRAAAAGKCLVEVLFYGGLIPGNLGEIEPLLLAGVPGIKAFLCDSGLPEFPAAGVADLEAAMPILARAGRPLLVHAELAHARTPLPGNPRRYSEYLASRPPAWESDAISMLITLCRKHRCPVHVVHLANAEALPLIQAAKREGLPITVETCPHYLHFAADEIPEGDTRYKCAPPIREAHHRERLWEALRCGLINTIGSDHSPCLPAMKHLASGDFFRAWGGIASLQLTLPIVWTGAVQRQVPLPQIFSWLSHAPAQLLQLPHKGRLAAGCDADLVVWDPEATGAVIGTQLGHRHPLTPYEGAELLGAVHRTYVRGQRVH